MSVLNLAQVFLDPFDNESYGGRLFGISINVATLLQETNQATTRWTTRWMALPAAARPVRADGEPPAPPQAAPMPPPQEPEGSDLVRGKVVPAQQPPAR